jgi:hypothetical protein
MVSTLNFAEEKKKKEKKKQYIILCFSHESCSREQCLHCASLHSLFFCYGGVMAIYYSMFLLCELFT